jgi:hypothetical protein
VPLKHPDFPASLFSANNPEIRIFDGFVRDQAGFRYPDPVKTKKNE